MEVETAVSKVQDFQPQEYQDNKKSSTYMELSVSAAFAPCIHLFLPIT